MRKRTLNDLYQVGRTVEIDDGQGDPVAVWIQKLNPNDHEQALRKASAARAVLLTYKNAPDSEEWQLAYSDTHDLGDRDVLVDFLAQDAITKKRMSLEAEIAADDEWAKDEYLQGLFDAWRGGVNADFARDAEDPEAKRVFDELKRYADQVTERLEKALPGIKREFAVLPDEELRQNAVEQLLMRRADNAFVKEYEICEIWLAARKPEDHSKYYFNDRDQVRSLAPKVYEQLLNAYREISVDPIEGKGSEETPDSSTSSEQSGRQETAVSSGPEAAAA